MLVVQALADPSTKHTLMDAVVGGVLVLTQAGTVWLSHIKGKRGTKAATDGLDKRLATLRDDMRTTINVRCDDLSREVAGVSKEVTEVKAYVIGPDGQNGLRGDVRELKAKVSGLLERETAGRRRR